MKTNIYILAGGKSVEHDVSLISATAICNALDRDKYRVFRTYITNDGVWVDLGETNEKVEDPSSWKRESSEEIGKSIGNFFANYRYGEKGIVVLPLHGTFGEDGKIQGLFETANIPYTGDGVLPSAVAMDKTVMKDIFKVYDIPQAKYLHFNSFDYSKGADDIINRIEKEIPYPVFVKPSNGGSSVGASPANNRDELLKSIELALNFDSTAVVEELIVGREIQFSVMGHHDPKCSIPGEFIMERPFFDYEAKYLEKKIIPVMPARMSEETMKKMQETAIKAYKALRCNSLARVDFFIMDDESFKVCEINTMPGFTQMSFTPKLWEPTDGTTYEGVVEKMIKLGFENFEEKSAIHRSRND